MKIQRPFVWLLLGCMFLTVSCLAQVEGCTDPLAINHDPSAAVNDGSCIYDPATVAADETFLLDASVSGTSGLILWDGSLWTHNDHLDTCLYGIDVTDARIDTTLALAGVDNFNWEEISQDDTHLYLGDFGNNESGNRTDLHILRIEKSSLLQGKQSIDTIFFSYADQTDLSPADPNATDYDCEAFVVAGDSIYLFTKQWTGGQTTLYALPNRPGAQLAVKKETFNVNGLVTGATYMASKRLLVLCAYNTLLSPFLYLMYDFRGKAFFSGNKRKITISLPFHQVEGIATNNGLNYFLTNEHFELQPLVNTPQKLHHLDMSDFLEGYLGSSLMARAGTEEEEIRVYPNPAAEILTLETPRTCTGSFYSLSNNSGLQVLKGMIIGEKTGISLADLASGIYYLEVEGASCLPLKVIRR